MHRAPRQIGKAVLRLEIELVVQETDFLFFEERPYLLRGKAPPPRAARIFQVCGIGARREMQAAEERTELGAFGHARTLERAPGQARDERRRLVVQNAKVLVGEIRDRRRARNAVAREVRHEVDVERQLFGGQPLEQREDVAALRRGDEIVGVLDAGLDRLARNELADRIVRRATRRARLRRQAYKPTS